MTKHFVSLFFYILIFCLLPVKAEDWPGYEGKLHQSSSQIDVDPATIRLKWVRRLDTLTHINDGRSWNSPEIGTFYSRNLTYYNGKLGLCATTSTNAPNNVARAMVLDAGNGNILNCVRTNQRYGPYKSQYDACDTGMGEQVVTWDPDTGFFFMSIGGDQPDRHALDLLANAGTYTGTAQTAVGAYESLAAAWPDIRSAHTTLQSKASEATNPRLKRSECPESDSDNPPQLLDEFPSGSSSASPGNGPSNKAGFFEVQPGSDYIANDRSHSHDGQTAIMLSNKKTGLVASYDWYQANNTDLGWPVFKMWGGTVCDKDMVYYMGGFTNSNVVGGPVGANVYGQYKGLRISCLKYVNQNLGTNDGGYTGPGMNETAVKNQVVFEYTLNSTDLGNSWWETDDYFHSLSRNTYRNKAMLTENDNLWVAWKPGLNDPVQLVKANSSAITTYNLSVGSGVRGWDIWSNMAYAQVGGTKYMVYALFNANQGPAQGPAGPATLTVFNATTGAEAWTFQLNNASQTGNYPDFRPHSHDLYNEQARMVIAGKYAYVAWVDTSTGPNLKLKVISLDITTASAPTTPPTPFVYDLGVARNTSAKNNSPGGGPGNLASRVSDMMAVDGALYILVNESCDLGRPGHVYAQQVISLTSDAATPTLTSIEVTPSSTTLLAGNTQQFTAVARDQFGAAMNPQPSITWTFSGSAGNGSINSSGLFTAGSTDGGPFTITATSGTINGTASVTVQSGFTVTFQDETGVYTGTTDTWIGEYGTEPSTDNGGSDRLNCDHTLSSGVETEDRRVLIKFDLSSIPTNAVIQSASLTFVNTRTASNAGGNDVIEMHRITSAWTESHTWNTGMPTTTPTGIALPSVLGYTTGGNQPYIITGMGSLVQGWVSGSYVNQGVLLICTNATMNFRFAGSEHATTSFRPKLQIVYTLPSADTDFDNLPDSWEMNQFNTLAYGPLDDPDGDGQNNGQEYSAGTNPASSASRLVVTSGVFPVSNQFTITWTSIDGRNYQVEFSPNMTSWNLAAAVQASGNSTSWTDDGSSTGSSPGTASKRFYRVKLP